MKRKNPDTSLEAYAKLKPEQLRAIYRKIIEALKIMGEGSSQQIAAYLTLDDEVVRKRLSELKKMGILYKPGHKVPTKKGCEAYVWQICKAGAKTELQEKLMPGPTVQDYAKTIQQIQNNLF